MPAFHVVSIFPELVDAYAAHSLIGKAQKKKLLTISAHNPRNYVKDAHRSVDDKPYGGGAGMVMKAEPILRTVDDIKKKHSKKKFTIVVLSAKGKQFNQKIAARWAKSRKSFIFITGRYEGIDERVKKALGAEEISIGPYVLTDGDIAAMALLSATARLIPGVIKFPSLSEESHWNLLHKSEEKSGRGVEYPHYTRPEKFRYKGKTYRVPKALLSGNHGAVADWRKKHSG